MKKEHICIVCPNGCELQVELKDGEIEVEGALCKRGRDYIEQELINPVRTIASSVLVENGEYPLASVRLSKPVPKNLIFDVMKEIDNIKVEAPLLVGQVVIEKVCGCDSNVIITKKVNKKG